MKILVIQKKKIGDVLTSTIILEALREEYPKSELHYLVYESCDAVAKGSPFIDKLVVLDEKSRKGKRAFVRFLFKIRREKYDIVIDAYGKPNSVVIAWFSGAKKTISFEKSYSKILLSDVVKRHDNCLKNASKAIEHRMLLLQPLGIDFKLIVPKIFLAEDEIAVAKQKIVEAGLDLSKNLIMISVLGSENLKNYPAAFMAQMLDFIVEKKEVQILFNYFPYQREQALATYNLCDEKTKKQIYFDFFENDLRAFLAILKHCQVLIGNEGGAANMAKALSIPTFSIYSPGVIKTDWNLSENENTNISVHYDDYPDVLPQNGDLLERYDRFEPRLFSDRLQYFLNFNCS
jgi:heptosyltransferase II